MKVAVRESEASKPGSRDSSWSLCRSSQRCWLNHKEYFALLDIILLIQQMICKGLRGSLGRKQKQNTVKIYTLNIVFMFTIGI